MKTKARPEKTERVEPADSEAIRIAVEDYRGYAAQVTTCPELRADVDQNCTRLLKIADKLEQVL